MASGRIPENPGRRGQNNNQAVQGGGCQSGWILSLPEAGRGERGGDGIARRDSKNSVGETNIWLSTNHSSVAPRRPGSEFQASAADDARGQLALPAAKIIRENDGLRSRVA